MDGAGNRCVTNVVYKKVVTQEMESSGKDSHDDRALARDRIMTKNFFC
jgi:hypothetical protein